MAARSVVLFCFVKQKTAYEMRISDWSSDVCSSDLKRARPLEPGGDGPGRDGRGQSGFAAAGVFTESRACLGSTLQLCPAKEIRCNRSDRKSTRLNSSH